MKRFALLTLSLLLSLNIYANEEKNIPNIEEKESHWFYTGVFTTYIANIQMEFEKPGVAKMDELINYNSLQIGFDYSNENFYFSVTPYAYKYFTESDQEFKNPNFVYPFKNNDFFFRSLYMSYTLDKLTFGIGILPLSNSFPIKYTNDYYQDGDGLNTMNDVDPLAVFIKYQFNDSNKLLIGAALADTGFIPTGHYTNIHNTKNTNGLFIIQNLLHDKFEIINEFIYRNVYYEGIHSGDVYSYGSGVSWDDSEYSGWTFYDVINFSLYKNNTIAVKSQMLSNIPPAALTAYPDSFAFDNNTYTGGANLLGLRKDFDLFNIDSFINLEWFHVFGDWTSANRGALYNSNYNQVSNIRHNSYFINYGIRLSELSTLKLSYTYLEFDEALNIGAPSSTPLANSFGPQRSHTQITKLTFTYKF